jgi:hypothetical protein
MSQKFQKPTFTLRAPTGLRAESGMAKLTRYAAPTSRAVEDRKSRETWSCLHRPVGGRLTKRPVRASKVLELPGQAPRASREITNRLDDGVEAHRHAALTIVCRP